MSPEQKGLKTQIGVRIDNELYKTLGHYAVDMNLNPGEIVERALRAFFDLFEEDKAKYGLGILEIYQDNRVKAGEMLLIQAIRAQWFDRRGRADDLNAGLQWLLEKGYLEEKTGHNHAYFLTESGEKTMKTYCL